jgi:uncharacterized protein (DUF736 family)
MPIFDIKLSRQTGFCTTHHQTIRDVPADTEEQAAARAVMMVASGEIGSPWRGANAADTTYTVNNIDDPKYISVRKARIELVMPATPTQLRWKRVSEARYDRLLEWCSPEAWTDHGFLGGDPWNHRVCAVTGEVDEDGTFAAFLKIGDQHYECTDPLTKAEFLAVDPMNIEIVEGSDA